VDTSWSDTVVLVTGATAGFGAAIARRFCAAGARVVGAGRRGDRLANLARELGPTFLPLPFDVRDRRAVERAIASLPAGFSPVDVLVNNAGLARGMEPAPRASLDDWDEMVETNCRGLLYCTHALLPALVSRGKGHIINLGSVAGSYPYPGGNVYGATKAFVRQFSLNLRSDLHGTGVRVACVEPGLSGGTEFSRVRFHGDEARAAGVYRGMQALCAADIAETILWIAAQPAHVNVNSVELMPVAQSFAPFQVHRKENA